MGSETPHRIWPRPATRWWHRLTGVAERGAGDGAAPARQDVDFDEAQARALCELLAAPGSGITRVTVVGAGRRLLNAIEDVAEERGVVIEESRRSAGGGGSARLKGAEALGDTRREAW